MGTTTRMKRRRRSRQRSVRRGVSASVRASASPRRSRWRSVTEIATEIATGITDGCSIAADGWRLGAADGCRLEDSRLEGSRLEGSRNVVIKSQAQLSRFDACLAHVAQATTTTGRGETRTMIS